MYKEYDMGTYIHIIFTYFCSEEFRIGIYNRFRYDFLYD